MSASRASDPEEEASEIGEVACLLLSLLGSAVSGPPVGASPVADRKALLLASEEVLRREHAHAVRLCFAKGASLVPELTERQVAALALAPPKFLTPDSGISMPLWLPTLVTVRTAAPDASQAATGGAGLTYEVVQQPDGPVRPFTGTRYDPEQAALLTQRHSDCTRRCSHCCSRRCSRRRSRRRSRRCTRHPTWLRTQSLCIWR